MIGDRYGYRPFPAIIDASEFDMLMAVAEDDEGVSVIKEWYLRDDNAIPACYMLQVHYQL